MVLLGLGYVSIDPSCFARCRTLELGEDELGVVMIRSDGDYSLVIVVAAMEGPLWLGPARLACGLIDGTAM